MGTTPTWRYAYGDANPTQAPFIPGNAFNMGDFMYMTSTQVTPPDGQTQYAVQPANQLSVASAIADPTTAPTIEAVSATNVGPGFTVASTGISVAYTVVTANNLESGPSALSARMSTSGDAITTTGVTLPAGAVKARWYVTTDGGTAATLQLAGETINGNGITIGGPPPTGAVNPPAAASLTAQILSQLAFAQSFIGIAGNTYDGSNPIDIYGIKSGYAVVLAGGVFNFACASANWNVGDLFGITISGGLYQAQTIVKVPQSQFQCAIGRIVRGGTALTTVRGQIIASVKTMLAQQY